MHDSEEFAAVAVGGTLNGWVAGQGTAVLLLHGGPGLGHEYMDPVAAELLPGFRVASFQQRGLGPSTLEGPFTIAQAIDDVVAVLDALEWSRALVVGHSWGGHLALRFAAAHPDRVSAMLAIEPVGVVGDGGVAAFQAELIARVPRVQRERLRVLAEREQAGEATAEERHERRALVWPAYFADPQNVAPMPPLRMAPEAVFKSLAAEMAEGTEEVAAALRADAVRYGVLAGAASPIPWGQAARASAELSASAQLTIIPSAGHFVWVEAPGCVRAALGEL